MRGLGDLRAPYDASKKCIVDDKTTSSQEEQNFFIYNLRSTLIVVLSRPPNREMLMTLAIKKPKILSAPSRILLVLVKCFGFVSLLFLQSSTNTIEKYVFTGVRGGLSLK